MHLYLPVYHVIIQLQTARTTPSWSDFQWYNAAFAHLVSKHNGVTAEYKSKSTNLQIEFKEWNCLMDNFKWVH